MNFPLPARHFCCAVIGTPLLCPNRRLALEAVYDELVHDGIHDAFVMGDVVEDGFSLGYAVQHYPRQSEVRTWSSDLDIVQAMTAAGREDWVLLPPDGLQLQPKDGVAVQLNFVDDPAGSSYAAALRAPPRNGPVDSLTVFADSSPKEGDAEHIGTGYYIRTGAFSAQTGLIYLDVDIDRRGRVRDEYILHSLQF